MTMLRGCGALQIEPTDHCNLRCAMCHPHAVGGRTPHGFKKGVMDHGLFTRIIDGIARDRVDFDHLILQWLGEPTLNPRLLDMLEHAQSAAADRFHYVRIDTNALLAGEGFARRLAEVVASCPGTTTLLVFSLDAATRETFSKVKGADAYDDVAQNIRRLFTARSALPPVSGALNFQFQFVLQEANAREAGAFVRSWKTQLDAARRDGCFDEIMVKRISIGTGGPAQEAADARYDEVIAREGIDESIEPHCAIRVWKRTMWTPGAPADTAPKRRPPCPALWKTPVVRWDGKLHVCCADTDGRIEAGSLVHHTFKELWDGDRIKAYRRLHVRGAFDRIPVCGPCGGISFYELTEEETAPYR